MKRFAILSVFFLWGGYAASQTVVSVDAKQIINEGYIGNGAQWDPYQLDYGKGRLDISEADWPIYIIRNRRSFSARSIIILWTLFMKPRMPLQ